MKTERGIYYNLKESEYKYICNGFIFHFSSELYKNKFIETCERFVSVETAKLEIKYHCKLFVRNMLLISYYKQVEKRGFYVLVNCGLENDYIELDKDEVFKITNV